MRAAILLATCLSMPILAQSAPVDPAVAAKRTDIKKLMAVTEVVKNQIAAMTQMLNTQRQMNPMITQAFVDGFLAETTPEKLEAVFFPVYEKHLTSAEVKALLAFYTTPEGASFVKKQGLIQSDSLEAGQRMGMEIGAKVMQKLQAGQ